MSFFSRTRGVPWTKGETSGNVLRLTAMAKDCEGGDTLLVIAEPAGPTCSEGNRTCFDGKEKQIMFGPGNQYVTAAKEYAERYGAAIDMPAGPSEVLVLADDSANPAYVAADLLSQAEHGPDSQVVLLTTSKKVQNEVQNELSSQIQFLERSEIAAKALERSLSIFFTDIETAFAFANTYAPEHWIIQTDQAEACATRVQNAGSVFVGSYTPESAGDYASGTNHTLPTGGWAQSVSGLSVADFQKTVSFQTISPLGLKTLAPTITRLARAEGLTAHARAVSIRVDTL